MKHRILDTAIMIATVIAVIVCALFTTTIR